MSLHTDPNAALQARRIICAYEDGGKPKLYGTKSRHNAQYMKVRGKSKPAIATISETLVWVK